MEVIRDAASHELYRKKKQTLFQLVYFQPRLEIIGMYT